MGFWQDFPGPSWFHFFGWLLGWRAQGILRPGPPTSDPPSCDAGIRFGPMSQEKEEEYRDFLKDNYRMAIFSYYDMPPWEDSWIGIEARVGQDLIGMVVSSTGRAPCSPVIKRSHTPATIDMFCVATPYRRKGVASRLLWEIDKATARAGRLTHIFMKEGAPLWWLPPLATGRWVYRRRERGAKGTPSARVQFKDTRWRTIPLKEPIGEIVFIETGVSQAEVDAAADASEFKVVLSTADKCPSWEKDSAFSWYAYNWL